MLAKWMISAACCMGLVFACGGSSTTVVQNPTAKAEKGGGQKGTAAKGSGQKVGGRATADKSKGADKGAVYQDLTCDADLEGLSWCDSASEIAFCSGGEWWILDCTHPDIDGDFCGDNGNTVDCYLAADF
jgi:hypothetical protein